MKHPWRIILGSLLTLALLLSPVSVILPANTAQASVSYSTIVYFADASETNPASVRVLENESERIYFDTTIVNSIYNFTFGSQDNLYFSYANDYSIYVEQSGDPILLYNNETYVKDIGFDTEGNFYFSEAYGAGADGYIYELEIGTTPTASLVYTVDLDLVDGFWGGDFTFNNDYLYLSSGNTDGASIYRVPIVEGSPNGDPEQIYGPLSFESITGIAFAPNGSLFYTNWGSDGNIYELDLTSGNRELFFSKADTWLTDVYVSKLDPSIDSIDPTSGSLGETLDVTINGSHLTGATNVYFEPETPEITVNEFTVDNPGQITANITIGLSAVGLYDVSVSVPPEETASLPLAFEVLPLDPLVVVNTNDSGPGSLRTAILNANNWQGPGKAMVTFNIPGEGPHVIYPLTLLPSIDSNIIVDGYSQPGAIEDDPETMANTATLQIVLDGSELTVHEFGLDISGMDNEIYGLVVRNFPADGIRVWGPEALNNVIAGNFIFDNGTVDEAPPFLENIGLRVGNLAEQNYIVNNVVSGNVEGEISIDNFAHWNTIEGNLIGTDPTGMVAEGIPGAVGVRFQSDAYGNDLLGNVISGNGSSGVAIYGGAFSTWIDGNLIGTDIGGGPLGNFYEGIYISADENAIGFETGNIIAYNNTVGVRIVGECMDNSISQNQIFANGGVGIDLGDDGPTANDPQDADLGPNGLQNYPIISQAISGNSITISGTLNSTPFTEFFIEFFINETCDLSGYGEGETYLGTGSVLTDEQGDADFEFVFEDSVPPGLYITATATSNAYEALSSTSEFSACVMVNGLVPPVVGAVDPEEGFLDDELLEVSITGMHFTGLLEEGGVSFGEGITVNSYSGESDTEIAAIITISPEAMLGFRDVTVNTLYGSNALEDGFEILDPAPSITGLTIDPIPAYTYTDLTATPEGWSDPSPNGNEEIYLWDWFNNGDLIEGADTAILDSSNFIRGDQITVVCTPWDGIYEGVSLEAIITISDSLPIARFIFTPEDVYEGDIVEFLDQSYDPDGDTGGDEIVSWFWEIDAGSSDAKRPFFIPPDGGSYDVTLTVTNGAQLSNSIMAGEIATDGTEIPELWVMNASPLLNALDIEALPGVETSVFARFLDPGWLDEHWASCDLVDPEGLLLEEDNLPCVSTGRITGPFTPQGEPGEAINSEMVIFDDSEDDASDNFRVLLIGNQPDRHEPNDDLSEPPILPSGGIYLSWIQDETDVDVFEVRMPYLPPEEPPLLPADTELLVTLKDLPTDLDLVILAELPESLETAPFQMSPFQMSPFQMSPFQMSPFQMSPFQMSPFQRSPFQMSPFQMSPFQMSPFQRSAFMFDRYPLSQMGFTGLEGNDIGGTDISLSELGLDVSGSTGRLIVVGFSANHGTDSETLLVRSEFAGTKFYIVVLGANGAWSTSPYALQIETSRALDLSELLGQMVEGAPLVPEGGTSETVVLYNNPNPEPMTLFVTQRERMQALYGVTSWDNLMLDLIPLANHAQVVGDIISVPSNIYDVWDTYPYDVDLANMVANEIREIVQGELSLHPSIEYVVFLGSDQIIPYRRVPDETIISNERFYLMSSFLRPESPLFASIMEGYNLTDDYYVDLLAIPWQGRALYLPDLAIARLVETPEEIGLAASTFLDNDGFLNPSTALVTGYDFFQDGAMAVAGVLPYTMTELINETWTASDLSTALLASPDTASLGAHFTHYAALSAYGFHQPDMTNFLSSIDVALMVEVIEQEEVPILANGLIFSMGCHAGFNAPDGAVGETEPGLGIDPALDFPQVMTQQQTAFWGSTGFGLGDDAGIGGTERLIVDLAEELIAGGSIGQATSRAKHDYLSSLSTMTVYDEKSSIQFTLYGLPQYGIPGSLETALSNLVQVSQQTSNAPTEYSLDLTIIENGQVIFSDIYDYFIEETEDGNYITAEGGYQATAHRPIQPRIVYDIIDSGEEDPVHSIQLVSSSYVDLEPFDPVITRPTTEWELGFKRNGDFVVDELQICMPTFWPSEQVMLKNIELGVIPGEDIDQTMIIIPGQFRCIPSPGDVEGLQRLYTELTFELVRGSGSDWDPPVIHSVDLVLVDEDNLAVIVDATDENGIAEVRVTAFQEGGSTQVVLGEPEIPEEGPFTLGIPIDTMQDYRVDVEAIDPAGNQATNSAKGAILYAISLDAGPDRNFTPNTPVEFVTTIANNDQLVLPVTFMWEFGDGEVLTGELTPAEVAAGAFTVSHTYLESAPSMVTASVQLTDYNGGTGADEVILSKVTGWSSLLQNAVTSRNRVIVRRHSIVNGNVLYTNRLNNYGIINGETTHDPEMEWPETSEFTAHYYSDVAHLDPYTKRSLNLLHYEDTIPPLYRNGNLKIRNWGPAKDVALEGTIYVTGNLTFVNTGSYRTYNIDLNGQTIFVEGDIIFPWAFPSNVTISGKGCIVALGDIIFKPDIGYETGDFLAVVSLEGSVVFDPRVDFYGAVVAGNRVDIRRRNILSWPGTAGGLNFP